jgi:hypothetical protein
VQVSVHPAARVLASGYRGNRLMLDTDRYHCLGRYSALELAADLIDMIERRGWSHQGREVM